MLLSGAPGAPPEAWLEDYGESDPEPYDLNSRDHIIMGRFPALEIVHERFIRHFRLTLSAALRRVVDISLRSTELLKFGEVLRTLPVPSSLNLFRMAPLRGNAIMALETRLVFTLIDLFFGGSGELEVRAEGRDFSAIEARMVKRVVMAALEDLQEAWRPLMPLSISFNRSEVNPQFVAIVPPTEGVIVNTFDVEMGRAPMSIKIITPFSLLEPLSEMLADPSVSGATMADERWKTRVLGNLAETPLEMSAMIDLGAITVRDFLDWKPGALLTAKGSSSKNGGRPPVDLYLGANRKYQGVLTAVGMRQGVRIDKVIPKGAASEMERIREAALALHEAEREAQRAQAAETAQVDEDARVTQAAAEAARDPQDFVSRLDSPELDLHEAANNRPLSSLNWLAPEAIANYISFEHPQTIALILGVLEDSEVIARVLGLLPENLQADVTYRLSTMEEIQPGIVEEINQVLAREIAAANSDTSPRPGGILFTAKTLAAMGRGAENRVLATIEESNPHLAEALRVSMFGFDDLVQLDSHGMQMLLKEMPTEELLLALKTARPELLELVFSCMSNRAREMLKEDLELLGPVRVEDVERAQQNMVKCTRRLEDEGKLVIRSPGRKFV